MKMTREKKILLSLMLCGAVCNAAYAEEYNITGDTAWEVPGIEGNANEHPGLTGDDTVTITNGATLTMTTTEGDVDEHRSNLPLSGSGSSGNGLSISGDGSGSLVIIEGAGITGEAVLSSGDSASIKIDGLKELSMSGFTQGIQVDSGGTVNIGTAEADAEGTYTYTVGTVDIEVTAEGVYMNTADGSSLTINAENVNIKEMESASGGDGIYIGSTSTGSASDSLAITAKNINIEGFEYGIRNVGNASVTITQTGSDGEFNITNFNHDGIQTEGEIVITSEGTINITGDGSSSDYGIHSHCENGITIYSSGDINISGINTSNGAGLYAQTASNAITIQGYNGKNVNSLNISDGYYGIYGYASNGIHISDVTTMTISGASYTAIRGRSANGVNIDNVETLNISNNSWGIYSNAASAVNITNSGAVNFTGNDVVGIYSTTTNGTNITNAKTVTFDGNGEGIDTTVQNGVNITASGEVTFKNNGYGIFTTAENGVSITGVDGAPITKLTIDNNESGLVAYGGSLSFETTELSASGGENIAFAYGSSGSVTLTAESTTISGQTSADDSDWYGSFEAQDGGSVTLTTNSITASRTDGKYLGYVWDESSSVSIKADTGTITGAFWTGATDDLDTTEAGTLSLDLGDSTSWNITQDSKLTDLTFGDASGLVFSYLGSEGGTGGFLNLYAGSLSSGSGSNITMNINASALNESDHIYIDGEHTGTSVINLNANGSDLSDTVLGTILVSVNNESGSFTAGSGTNGTYEGALYNWKYTLAMADGTEESRKIQKTGELMTMDDYSNDWYLTDVEIETEEEPEPGDGGDPGPGPAQPNPGGGTPTSTTTVDAIRAANAVNYYAFRETDKLLRRMGELRNNGEDEQGVWIRVKGAKTGRNGSFENKYVHYEGGYDHLVKNDHREKRYEGVSISHTEGDVKYKEVTGSGKAHDEEIAFYRVDQYKHGHYLDLVTRIGIYNNRFGVYDTNQNKIHGKNHNYGISTSAEYGRKKDYAHDWYVEPQTQVTLGYLSGSDYTTSNQVDVSNGSISSAVGRIGVNIGKGFTDKNGRRGKFYAKANWLKEFLGSYGIDMTTENSRRHAHGNYKDTWFEWGFGVTYQYTKNNFFYADVEKTHGSAYYKNWAWNVGLRWTFN